MDELRELLRREYAYKEGINEALLSFKAERPFKQELEAKKGCFKRLHENLNGIHNRKTGLIFHSSIENNTQSGNSHFNLMEDSITLMGRISLITYLHEYAHALGFNNELDARAWSIKLFKKTFPKSFKKLKYVNGMMLKQQ